MVQPHYRIGVDIGGTFTDLVLMDEGSGRLFSEKVLTTPEDPSEAVLSGVASLLAKAGVRAGEISNVIHGTTLVANALIERKGVKTALVTTAGFRDVLEIGRELRYDTYDLFIEMPRPLVPRELRFEVVERIGPKGEVLVPLDQGSARALAEQLRASDVEAVAVVFLHSFRNPGHETAVKRLFAEAAPRLTVCASSEVMAEIDEYERTSTTVANAYVHPIFRRYLGRLVGALRELGIAGELYLMLSDGGTVHGRTAAEFPIRLVQSGPAGGVQASTLYGRLARVDDVLCFDMGGTTAKACLVEKGRPMRTTDFEVARVYRFAKGSGLPLKLPTLDMIEIGAGGGSIARVDRLGLLQVGPESAGSSPGPACYALGGSEPTVTDADLILGYLDAGSFLGGDMALDRERAARAIEAGVARPLGLSVVEAAWGIYEIVNENMAQAATIHALERGRKVADFALVAIGGAGPVHACNLARRMGVGRVICLPGAGVASAFGLLASPVSFAFVKAQVSALDRLDLGEATAFVDELAERGRAQLTAAGVAGARMRVELSALMRYLGQGYEVEVPLTREVLLAGDRARIAEAFEAVYRELFGRSERMPAEVISWRVVVSGPEPRLELAAEAARGADAEGARRGARPVYFAESGGFIETGVFRRDRLAAGAAIEGPAIIEERESTLVLPPRTRARCDLHGSLIVDLL
ncbi:MAG: hydantoinase/oxoprolinase family protein [Proteobacteria bacterium]|nr:hydantoinase/oxoprolinase family protein [Pseudomonadota bacterium]